MLRNAVCGICGGVMTAWFSKGQRWVACMRCDTDECGHGYGPPRFVQIWNERIRDAWSAWGKDERGSERE